MKAELQLEEQGTAEARRKERVLPAALSCALLRFLVGYSAVQLVS
jgi:hypothetical protein